MKSALRGDTMINLTEILIRDLGTQKGNSINQDHILGGVEFKSLLLKIIEIKPTEEQILVILQHEPNREFDNKYIVALLLTYLRIQYYYLYNDRLAKKWKEIFKHYLKDYRKMKSVKFELDCWSPSIPTEVTVVHMDELVEWLSENKSIWGITLGQCRWAVVLGDDSDSSDSDNSDSDGGNSESSDSE